MARLRAQLHASATATAIRERCVMLDPTRELHGAPRCIVEATRAAAALRRDGDSPNCRARERANAAILATRTEHRSAVGAASATARTLAPASTTAAPRRCPCARPDSRERSGPKRDRSEGELTMLQRVVRSTVIDAPIERVWAVLRDFNSHDHWHGVVARAGSKPTSAATRSAASAASRSRTATASASSC